MQAVITIGTYKSFVVDATGADIDTFTKVLAKCRPIQHEWNRAMTTTIQLIDADAPDISIVLANGKILPVVSTDSPDAT